MLSALAGGATEPTGLAILGVWKGKKQTVMADVRGNREHLFSSEGKKKTARNLKGQGIHNCVMNIVVEEKWGYR